jgi:hypothetical protein
LSKAPEERHICRNEEQKKQSSVRSEIHVKKQGRRIDLYIYHPYGVQKKCLTIGYKYAVPLGLVAIIILFSLHRGELPAKYFL